MAAKPRNARVPDRSERAKYMLTPANRILPSNSLIVGLRRLARRSNPRRSWGYASDHQESPDGGLKMRARASRIGTADASTLLFVLLAPPALAGTIKWSGVTSGSWSTATNWQGGVLPM